MDLIAHLTRQAAFSRATFGPGPRTKGVTDHIRKELEEVEKCYEERTRTVITGSFEDAMTGKMKPIEKQVPVDLSIEERHADAAAEWADVAILGLDGLLRSISAANPDWTFDRVAREAASMILAKQGKNELRDWPDWRQASSDKAIEHVRGKHD